MVKNFVVAVSLVIFAMIAGLALMIADLRDREAPAVLHAEARVTLDFGAYRGETPAPDLVKRTDTAHGLGLFKVAPDPEHPSQTQYIAVTGVAASGDVPSLGDRPAGVIVGPERLASSTASGTYVVTSERGLPAATQALAAAGVTAQRVDTPSYEYVLNAWRLPEVFAPLVAVCSLTAALTLYTLARSARSRALRVLGGGRPAAIYWHDVGPHVLGLAGAAVGVGALGGLGVGALGGLGVGLARGWVFVTPWLQVYALFAATALAAALALLFGLVGASWPRVRLIARREPGVRSFRVVGRGVQFATLFAMVAFVGTAWVSLGDASQTARQAQVWQGLGNLTQVTIPVRTPQDFATADAALVAAVTELDAAGLVSLSATVPAPPRPRGPHTHDAVVLANDTWLDVSHQRDLAPLNTLDEATRASLQPQLDLWARDGADPLSGAQFYTTRPGETFAAAAPGVKGDLEFYARPLIITLPSVADTLSDATLAAFVNNTSISFDGLEPVSRALADGPLHESATVGAPQVTYLAENGIINAQTAQYRMQLLAAAVGATLVAFLVLAAVNAAIAALLGARRDFPLRLHGIAWARIVRGRVTLDVGLAALACALAILTQQVSTAIPPTLASIPACLAVVCVAHLVATRFVFTRVATRQFS